MLQARKHNTRWCGYSGNAVIQRKLSDTYWVCADRKRPVRWRPSDVRSSRCSKLGSTILGGAGIPATQLSRGNSPTLIGYVQTANVQSVGGPVTLEVLDAPSSEAQY